MSRIRHLDSNRPATTLPAGLAETSAVPGAGKPGRWWRVAGISVLVATLGLVMPAAAQTAGSDQPVDLAEVARSVSETLRAHVYDPAVLDSERYAAIEHETLQLAGRVATRDEFVSAFNRMWQDGPFSHVRLVPAQQSAEQLASYLDTMNVGGTGAVLEWQGDTAVLTVNTMMGQDTIAQIDDAYQVITEGRAAALIIDLRNNEGGAFAVKPLVGHLIGSDLDVGAFLSQRWARKGSGSPSREVIRATQPWRGWSLVAFWNDVQRDEITRLTFVPMTPRFEGPVYVLTSHRTASAAELAVDALMASGRVVVVGERTAGQMLSQKPYDLPGGLQLYLPIADYVSLRSGRIEGTGITPDLVVDAGSAMETARGLLPGSLAQQQTPAIDPGKARR